MRRWRILQDDGDLVTYLHADLYRFMSEEWVEFIADGLIVGLYPAASLCSIVDVAAQVTQTKEIRADDAKRRAPKDLQE